MSVNFRALTNDFLLLQCRAVIPLKLSSVPLHHRQTERTTGRWSVQGKTLTLSFGDNENANPFTIYEGQLVFPNIPKRRQFWEKI